MVRDAIAIGDVIGRLNRDLVKMSVAMERMRITEQDVQLSHRADMLPTVNVDAKAKAAGSCLET